MFVEKTPWKATVTAIFLSFLFIAPGHAAPADKDPVAIAIIDPLTGPMAGVGLPLVAHIKFEAERLNADGGMNGHPFRIIGLDNKVSPRKAWCNCKGGGRRRPLYRAGQRFLGGVGADLGDR